MTKRDIESYNVNKLNMYYDDLGTIGNEAFWSMIKLRATRYYDKLTMPHANVLQQASTLRKMAKAERAKEVKVLNEFFGADLKPRRLDDTTLLRAVNEAFGLMDLLEKTIAQTKESMENKDKKVKADTRAGFITSNYGGYVEKALNNELKSKSFQDALLSGTYAQIEKEWNALCNRALDSALTEMLKARGADSGVFAKMTPLKHLLPVINQIQDFRRKYKMEFFSRYGFDKVQAEVLKEWAAVKASLTKSVDLTSLVKNVQKTFHSNLRGSGSVSIKGFVEESVATAITTAVAKNKNLAIKSMRTTNSHYSTDIIHAVGTLSAQAEILFNEANKGVKDKPTSAAAMEKFYKLAKSNMSDSAIIYESTKLYNLGKNSSGVFSGSKMKFASAIELLNSLNFPRAEALLAKVANTAEGAIFEADSRKIRDEVSRSLATHVAYFLFDDWKTIGKRSRANAIHIFRLSTAVIPLSFLLDRMATAIADTVGDIDSYTRFHFHIPEREFDHDYYTGNIDTSQEASFARWSAQQSAVEDATLQITFLRNFKQILTKDLAAIFDI